MSKERRDPLAKVDDGKRDFLKKMAIGTAYAVPVMTTFSLDGVRNTALAQGNYGPPRVTDMQDGPNRLEITFSRPMDTGAGGTGAGAKIMPCWWDTYMTRSTSGNWKWASPTKRVWTDEDCYKSIPITVLINQEPCGNKVLGADGVPCLPFSGTRNVGGCESS